MRNENRTGGEKLLWDASLVVCCRRRWRRNNSRRRGVWLRYYDDPPWTQTTFGQTNSINGGPVKRRRMESGE